MSKLVFMLILLSAPLLTVPAAIPEGSWIYADSSWEYIEILTVGPDDQAVRMVRSFDDAGRLDYSYQEGRILPGESPRFAAEETCILAEGEEGILQERIRERSEFVLADAVLTDACLIIDGRCFRSAREIIPRSLEGEPETAQQFVPLVNMSVYALQSRIAGFGTEEMTAYWREEKSFSGMSGSASVSMRSSGRVMFFFPRLPVMFDMIFDSFSVIEGLVLTGYQTIHSQNRRGDGYLYGALEIEGTADIIYGQEDGTNAVEIREGTVVEGTLEVVTGLQRYLIDAAVR